MKIAHISDVHLGGWTGKLRKLNKLAFSTAINKTIERKVDCVLMCGDLFDSAYPDIETLKVAFKELTKLKDKKIPVFLIAGSHDSSNGSSFLDILETTGLATNTYKEQNGKLIPTIYKDLAIYGYPGKRAGLEVKDIRKLKYKDSNKYKILMLHTTIDVVADNLPIDKIESKKLPKMDYYALGHIHERYNKNNIVYPSCIFPNSFTEMEKLKGGAFVIHDTNTKSVEFINIEQNIESIEYEMTSSDINLDLPKNKIITLKLTGKASEINLREIKEQADKKNSILLISKSRVNTDVGIDIKNILSEKELINKFMKENPSKFDKHLLKLMEKLDTEIQNGETKENYNDRIIESIDEIKIKQNKQKHI